MRVRAAVRHRFSYVCSEIVKSYWPFSRDLRWFRNLRLETDGRVYGKTCTGGNNHYTPENSMMSRCKHLFYTKLYAGTRTFLERKQKKNNNISNTVRYGIFYSLLWFHYRIVKSRRTNYRRFRITNIPPNRLVVESVHNNKDERIRDITYELKSPRPN